MTFVIVGGCTCSICASSVNLMGPANTRTDKADSRAGPTPVRASSFREIGIQKATLIGLSAGSTIALDAALAAPQRFDRLVLVGPSISGHVSRTPLPFTADLTAALQQRDYQKVSEVLLGSSVFAVPPESQALVRQMVMENDRMWSVPRELLRQTEHPAINRLDEIKIPMLIMLGENDLLQREEAELLSRRVSGARLVVVARGGHLLNLTSPEEFRAQVSQFLR